MKYKQLIRDGVDLLADKKAVEYYDYKKDDVYAYKTRDNYIHLIINKKDVFKNKKVITGIYIEYNTYFYRNNKGHWYLMMNDKNKKIIDCWHDTEKNVYKYLTKDGCVHKIGR